MHGNTKYTAENFKDLANKIHSNLYDYSRVDYKGLRSKLLIVCPIHGEFTQTGVAHLTKKRGCRKCVSARLATLYRDTKEDFLCKAKKLHGNQYDYSLVEFSTHHNKVKILCPKHGVYIQSVNSHLSGKRCRKCAKEQMKKDESFYNFTKARWSKITKEGYLYLVELTDGIETFYKVGIAKSITERFRYLKGYTYSVVNSLFSNIDTGKLWQLEKDFHLAHQTFRYIPNKTVSGFTECYKVCPEILQEFQKLKI